jgi:hypothetical protein
MQKGHYLRGKEKGRTRKRRRQGNARGREKGVKKLQESCCKMDIF